MNRRQALAAFGGLTIPLSADDAGDYLMINQAEIDAAREKAKRFDWAAATLKELLSSAEETLSKPVEIPARGGQWGHWYACKKDGVQLVADSPTRHRCPKCGTVYTGEPYDSVYVARVHGANSSAMRGMALAFRFTGREEFARKTAQLLLGYAQRYLSYPRHDPQGKDSVNSARVMSQTLDESTWLIPVTWAYTLVRSTLNEADQRRIETDLLIPAVDTIIGRSYALLPNIQCWKDAAIACVGFALRDEDLIAEALDHPVRGFRVLMSRFVQPGGLWSEGTLGYHHYALNALWPLAEAARRHGVDLYANDRYRAMFDAPLALALPDGTMPGFNDNPGVPLSAWGEVYEIAFSRWQRPEHGRVLSLTPRRSLTALLYGAESVPQGDPVARQSVVMREAGVAVLRSPHAAIAVRFGNHGGIHGHPDKLNIVTYGAGRLFGVDPGSIAYGVPLAREWYKTTVSHNTVVVDQTEQSKADGKYLDWSSTAGETMLKAAAEVYPGVTLRRWLRLRGATLEDRFECTSPAQHTYDWLFHAQGILTTSLEMRPHTGPVAAVQGYQHIEGVAECQTDGDWTARWENRGAVLTLRVKGAPGTMVFTGQGPGPNPADQVPLVLIRRRASSTVFEITHVFARA